MSHFINCVNVFLQPVDEIGQTYQDEENQAAILVRKEEDGLVLVSTIITLINFNFISQITQANNKSFLTNLPNLCVFGY